MLFFTLQNKKTTSHDFTLIVSLLKCKNTKYENNWVIWQNKPNNPKYTSSMKNGGNRPSFIVDIYVTSMRSDSKRNRNSS